jgi:hypothetical protein
MQAVWRWTLGSAGLAGMAALLAGCALGPAMTPQECAIADWTAIGYSDGAEGTSSQYLAARTQACANAGYNADPGAYAKGHAEGVRLFCRPERGYRLGEEGGSPDVTCPPELAGAFDDAWRDGREVYRARSAYESAESLVRGLFAERESLQRKLLANELGYDQSVTDEDKARHRNEVIRLRSDLISLERRLREAQWDARRARDDYDRVTWRIRRF